MQYRYENVKTFTVLCEDKLEEWFWNELFKAAGKGEVTWKKSTKTVYEGNPSEDKDMHSEFLVIRIKRD